MTKRQPALGFCAFLAFGFASLLLIGCAATKPQSFANSFLPSTPLPAPIASPLEKPPAVAERLYVHETPNLSPRIQSEIERRLAKAEEHFEAGKRAYQAADLKLARAEFDHALDVLLSAPEDTPDRHRLERRLDELVDSIYRYDVDQQVPLEAKQSVVYDKSPLESMLEMTFPVDPKLKPKVKEELKGTSSQLPLEVTDSVLSYINYFSTERGRKVLVYGLARAGRYRPLISRILDEEGVPKELLCLAQAESGFSPRAISYKKAVGMWQFVQDTGHQYGLQTNTNCDERLDPEKSTRAAAKMLHELYATFGDWYLAMAAYNCGPNCVDRAVQRTGYADFWELSARNALPKETMNYVPLILAMTIMTKNPKDYGLESLDLDRPIEYDTIDITSPANVALIADATDHPVVEIRELNPALLKSVVPAGYQLHVPKGTSNAVIAALENIPDIHRSTWRLYRVQTGDTLASIGKRFNTAADSIASANNRTVEAPEAGQLLVIPTAGEPDRQPVRRTAARYTARRPVHTAASSSVARKSTGSAANKPVAVRVPAPVLNRKAVPPVPKTAGLVKHTAAQ